MKNLVIIFAVIFLTSCKKDDPTSNDLTPVNVFDNFDSYDTGGFLGIESDGLWTTWTNSPGTPEDVYISSDTSFSPSNSLKFNGGGVTDVVLSFGNINSDVWEVSFMMFIPQEKGGYFNLLHKFDLENSNWAAQFYFSESGDGLIAEGSNPLQKRFSYPNGGWFKVGLIIDVDNDQGSFYINDGLEYSWEWSQGSMNQSSSTSTFLNAINFLPAAPAQEVALYFIDDFSFTKAEL